MRKTKIVCTLGPATDNLEMLKSLIAEGMDVARFNFSHGSHEEHGKRMQLLKEARAATGKQVPILLDTKGIKIRMGYVQGYSDQNKGAVIELQKDATVTYVCDHAACEMQGTLSTPERIYVDYDNMAKVVKIGQRVMLDDGLIATQVTAISGNEITAKILNGGKIKSRRAVNLPGARLDLEFLTPKDREDLLFGIAQDVDFVALSFVRRLDDVVRARKFLDENGGKHIMIISKIENEEGVENLDEILTMSDGVMVARGDMAVEIPLERVPKVQKEMIAKGLQKGKIVITATQMLHSMIVDPTPTRAEVSDIYNAVEDSTTCIMLSGETASGAYPALAVRTMSTVATEAESSMHYEHFSHKSHGHVTTSICHAAAQLAQEIHAKAIVAYSESGLTAKRLSSLRTHVPLLLVSDNERVVRQANAMWGLQPMHKPPMSSVDEMHTSALCTAEATLSLDDGDSIIVIAGTAVGLPGGTSSLRVMTKGDVVLRGTSLNHQRATGSIKICKDIKDANEKLVKGDIAVLYHLYPEFEPLVGKVGGILLASTEYDQHVLARAQAKNVPVIIDVHGVETRVTDGMKAELIGGKGVVVRKG